MNYIYDILLNYNSNLYDFFEWNNNDEITHIKKMPLFRVKNCDLSNFINKKIKFDINVLNKVYKKTELFNKNITIDYSFIITNQKTAVAMKLDNQGFITGYSKLLIDEESEVLEYSLSMEVSKIEYEVIGNRKNNYLKTRNEMYIKRYIYNELNDIIENKKYEKLNYLYLDCFNTKVDSNNIINKFKEQLENNWDNVYIKVYNFLKMTTSKR